MANITTDLPRTGGVDRIADAVFRNLSLNTAGSDKMRQYLALDSLGDDELAKRGLTRQSLGSFVFGGWR